MRPRGAPADGHPSGPGDRAEARDRRLRLAPVAGLFLLAPVSAEYLSGYLGPVLQLDVMLELLGGLLLLGPLYGAPALLIRELARRAGRGWPTILLLGAAFGLVQAGLIDQTLFHHDSFGDGPYWEALPARIPGLDLDAAQLLVFVGGHMIWTFAAPIAVVEACVPGRADRPWLGRVGIAAMTVLYLAAALVFYQELVAAEGFKAAPAQLLATAAAAAALAVAAFVTPRRPAPSPGRVPSARLAGGAAAALLAAHVLTREPAPGPWAWPSIALSVVLLAALGALLLVWSGRPGWTRTHVLAVAGTPLLLSAVLAFAVPPLDGVGDTASKYQANAVFLAGVLALLLLAYRRLRRG